MSISIFLLLCSPWLYLNAETLMFVTFSAVKTRTYLIGMLQGNREVCVSRFRH